MAHVRGRRLFAVLAIDVDELKRVNDTLGHATGDALLVGIAEAAMKVMRRGDLLARTGGDEFAAFLVDACTDGGVRAAQRILESIQNSRIDGMVPAVSIGIACATVDSDLLEVLKDADAAMYAAKRRGGNAYALAESALTTAAAQSGGDMVRLRLGLLLARHPAPTSGGRRGLGALGAGPMGSSLLRHLE